MLAFYSYTRFVSFRYDSRPGVGGLGPGSSLPDLVRCFLWLLGLLPALQPPPDGGRNHAVVGAGVLRGGHPFLHRIHFHCVPELLQVFRSQYSFFIGFIIVLLVGLYRGFFTFNNSIGPFLMF